jgi:hypothetical protein
MAGSSFSGVAKQFSKRGFFTILKGAEHLVKVFPLEDNGGA